MTVPWIMDAIKSAGDRVERGDYLVTTDGVLASAGIGALTLTHDTDEGKVVLTLATDDRISFVVLDMHEVRVLHHALGCAVVPYGEPSPLLGEG